MVWRHSVPLADDVEMIYYLRLKASVNNTQWVALSRSNAEKTYKTSSWCEHTKGMLGFAALPLVRTHASGRGFDLEDLHTSITLAGAA